MHTDSACASNADSLQRHGAIVPPDNLFHLFGTRRRLNPKPVGWMCVRVVFTVTDTVVPQPYNLITPSNIRSCQSGTWSAGGQEDIKGTPTKLQREKTKTRQTRQKEKRKEKQTPKMICGTQRRSGNQPNK